jgi:hypothetical protein
MIESISIIYAELNNQDVLVWPPFSGAYHALLGSLLSFLCPFFGKLVKPALC